MPITEAQYEKCHKRIRQLLDVHPTLLSDKVRFAQLSKDTTFISENETLYKRMSLFSILPQKEKDCLESTDLDNFVEEVEQFVSKWKTPPILSYFFEDPLSGKDDAELKMIVEHQYTEWGRYGIIKVFPWTTKEEIKQQYDEITAERRRWDFRPIALKFVENFKIQALRNAGWRYQAIRDYLFRTSDYGDIYDVEYEKRERKLKAEGKTETEIDDILRGEFPMDEYDQALEHAPTVDAIRKKKVAAKETTRFIMDSLKTGD